MLKLLDADRDVIGCAYPYRTVPLHEKVSVDDQSLRALIGSCVPYAVTFDGQAASVEVVNGICEVASIGTGLLLIRRSALVALAGTGSVGRLLTSFPYS